MTYIIQHQSGLYWRGDHRKNDPYPWTRQEDEAVEWSDPEVPIGIVRYWTMVELKDDRDKLLNEDGLPLKKGEPVV